MFFLSGRLRQVLLYAIGGFTVLLVLECILLLHPCKKTGFHFKPWVKQLQRRYLKILYFTFSVLTLEMLEIYLFV